MEEGEDADTDGWRLWELGLSGYGGEEGQAKAKTTTEILASPE